MGATLSAEQRQRAKIFFDKVDTDGSGLIQLSELQAALPLNVQKIKKMIKKADTSGDNKLNFNEFLNFFADRYRSLFEACDLDCRGTVSKKELKMHLRNIDLSFSDEHLNVMFGRYDTDGSSDLDFPEFCLMLADMGIF
eukprot:Colp12_sorted_trinity150504_noHs@35232